MGSLELAHFPELHDVLVPHTRNPSLHQPRGRCAEDYFPVRRYVVGMGVADKNLLLPKVWISRDPSKGQAEANAARVHEIQSAMTTQTNLVLAPGCGKVDRPSGSASA